MRYFHFLLFACFLNIAQATTRFIPNSESMNLSLSISTPNNQPAKHKTEQTSTTVKYPEKGKKQDQKEGNKDFLKRLAIFLLVLILVGIFLVGLEAIGMIVFLSSL